jgi:hypothetical protein
VSEPRCESTAYDRATGEESRCIKAPGHAGRHDDGALLWDSPAPASPPVGEPAPVHLTTGIDAMCGADSWDGLLLTPKVEHMTCSACRAAYFGPPPTLPQGEPAPAEHAPLTPERLAALRDRYTPITHEEVLALLDAEAKVAAGLTLAAEWEARGGQSVPFRYHEQHAADSAEAQTYERCGEALRAALTAAASAATKGDDRE